MTEEKLSYKEYLLRSKDPNFTSTANGTNINRNRRISLTNKPLLESIYKKCDQVERQYIENLLQELSDKEEEVTLLKIQLSHTTHVSNDTSHLNFNHKNSLSDTVNPPNALTCLSTARGSIDSPPHSIKGSQANPFSFNNTTSSYHPNTPYITNASSIYPSVFTPSATSQINNENKEVFNGAEENKEVDMKKSGVLSFFSNFGKGWFSSSSKKNDTPVISVTAANTYRNSGITPNIPNFDGSGSPIVTGAIILSSRTPIYPSSISMTKSDKHNDKLSVESEHIKEDSKLGKRSKEASANFHIKVGKRGYTLLGNYINSKTKVACKCGDNHEFTISPDEVRDGRGYCKICKGNYSLGEYKIKLALEFLIKEYHLDLKEMEKEFSFRDDKRRYDFRFYGFLIEFDGEQHNVLNKRMTPTKELLDENQKIDREKMQKALEMGYRMIRFDHTWTKYEVDVFAEFIHSNTVMMLRNNEYVLTTDPELYNWLFV